MYFSRHVQGKRCSYFLPRPTGFKHGTCWLSRLLDCPAWQRQKAQARARIFIRRLVEREDREWMPKPEPWERIQAMIFVCVNRSLRKQHHSTEAWKEILFCICRTQQLTMNHYVNPRVRTGISDGQVCVSKLQAPFLITKLKYPYYEPLQGVHPKAVGVELLRKSFFLALLKRAVPGVYVYLASMNVKAQAECWHFYQSLGDGLLRLCGWIGSIPQWVCKWHPTCYPFRTWSNVSIIGLRKYFIFSQPHHTWSPWQVHFPRPWLQQFSLLTLH